VADERAIRGLADDLDRREQLGRPLDQHWQRE
jgi:hypothetical protein